MKTKEKYNDSDYMDLLDNLNSAIYLIEKYYGEEMEKDKFNKIDNQIIEMAKDIVEWNK